MATVVVARSPEGSGLPPEVALKFLHRERLEDEDAVDSFFTEAQLGMRLRHESLCRAYGVETVEGRSAIVMEYLEGYPLAFLLRRAARVGGSPRSYRAAASLVRDIARGLSEVHNLRTELGCTEGAVHRDVSPQNVVVTPEGVGKLVDFGVAFSKDRKVKTKRGFIKGKLAYLPPEYLLGRKWDSRVDIWSLGVLLWEFLCQRRLFHPENTATLMKEIIRDPILPPSYYDPQIPTELSDLAMRALERNPENRISTAAEVAGALERFVGWDLTSARMSVREWVGTLDLQESPVSRCRQDLDPSAPFSTQPDLFTPGVGVSRRSETPVASGGE